MLGVAMESQALPLKFAQIVVNQNYILKFRLQLLKRKRRIQEDL